MSTIVTLTLIVFVSSLVIIILWNLYKKYNYQHLQTDAFNRLKISQPFTLGDYKHYYDITDDMISETATGGTVTHNTNEASVTLAVTATAGSKAIHQSKMYHHYMPGKSQFILSSFVFKEFKPGIIKRTGYFDDRDGIFFEQDKDKTLYFVIRSFVTGVAVDRKVPQSKWNGDKLSGWKIDLTKTQLLWIDFQWLGVGRVRCGFVHDDDYITCHTFYNSDNLDKVYMSNSNLPVRCEIVNFNSTVAASMDQICSTVASEGGYSEAGKDYSYISNAITANHNTETNIGIRLKTTNNGKPNRAFVRLSNVKVFSASKDVIFRVYKVSTFTGGSEITLSDYDGVSEIYDAPTTFTDKILISSGTVAANSSGSKSYGGNNTTKPGDAKKNFISQNFDSTASEAFVISVQRREAVGDDPETRVTIDWREIY